MIPPGFKLFVFGTQKDAQHLERSSASRICLEKEAPRKVDLEVYTIMYKQSDNSYKIYAIATYSNSGNVYRSSITGQYDEVASRLLASLISSSHWVHKSIPYTPRSGSITSDFHQKAIENGGIYR